MMINKGILFFSLLASAATANARIIQEMPTGGMPVEFYCDRLITKSKIFMTNFYRDQVDLSASEVNLRIRLAMLESNIQSVHIPVYQRRPLLERYLKRFYPIYLVKERHFDSPRGAYECSEVEKGAQVVFTQNSNKVVFLYLVKNFNHNLAQVRLETIEDVK